MTTTVQRQYIADLIEQACQSGARLQMACKQIGLACRTLQRLLHTNAGGRYKRQRRPIGLTDEFANDPSRQTLWAAFLRKNGLAALQLPEVVATLRAQLWPALIQASSFAPVSPNMR